MDLFYRGHLRVQGVGSGVRAVPGVRDAFDEGAADQRLALRRHEHLQRGGAVPHNGARHARHRQPTGRRLRLRLTRYCFLLFSQHGSYIHTQGELLMYDLFNPYPHVCISEFR